MTIYRALQKIETLTEGELKHCIQQMDRELENYEVVIKNYDQYKMKKYGFPHIDKLMEQRQKFVNQLNKI